MLHLFVQSLDSTLVDTDVHAVVLSTVAGVIELRDLHEPIAGVLATGIIEVHYTNNTVEELVTGKGVFLVNESNQLVVLCDAAIHNTGLDQQAILAAKEEAEKYLQSTDYESDPAEYARVQAVLEFELAKLKLAERKNKPKF